MKKMRKNLFLLLLICLCFGQAEVSAIYSLKNGKLKNEKYNASTTVEGHFKAAVHAMEKKNFKESVLQFNIVIHNFPESVYASESQYFLGVQYYLLGQLDNSNNSFANYMLAGNHNEYFEKAINYRLAIADLYSEGWKKHFFGLQTMPRWVSAYDDAVEIYDEIVMVLPNHEQAAKALYSKARLELRRDDFDASHDTLKTLLRRFQLNEYTVKAYLLLSDLYLKQAKTQSHNQDLLDLAYINLRHFKDDFSRHEGINDLENNIAEMEGIYALRLFETGQFYERTSRPESSVIYYSQVEREFPNTKAAELSKERLQVLNEYAIQVGLR
ncbi:Uncharacterized protein SCG7109_AP_00130 [Chlamydiales bacterium SCGC AG-110-M15]|nr:Uncharacterized protein SCG7109_AP_00130 [Chlamydiales bacterium SCGC AG-110-M15]